MRRLRRFGAAVTLACALTVGMVAAAPTAASAGPVTTTVTLGEFCEGLADVITFLESRPPSRLRDFLLDRARHLFEKYCS